MYAYVLLGFILTAPHDHSNTNPTIQAMLEALWAALKPGVSRQGGRVTSEWGEIGFQGKDPATDFRYMDHCL